MKLEHPILMAKIGGPHGIKGEVRVKSFSDDPLALGDYGSLYSNDGRKFRIMRMRPAKDVLVVKFKGVNFRDEAEALNGTELFIDRSMLPNDTEEDEYYVTDMIGCTVLDEAGEEVGTIKTVQNFGAGDLLEIVSVANQGTTLGPLTYLEFSRENVPKVDLENRTVTIRPPDEVSERDEQHEE